MNRAQRRASPKTTKYVASAAMADWGRNLTESILKHAATHSQDENDFQALTLTALTSITFGVVGELCDGDPDEMQNMFDHCDHVIVETLAKWRAELLQRKATRSR